jgi:hypothetical protein
MADHVVIESRFRGPRESGNGGYSCGALARFVDPRAAEVTLRLPPPLDRPLRVETADGGAELHDGQELVAEARSIDGLDLDLPDPVGVEEATAACEASPFQHEHPYPGCFVCGPERESGDGLRVTCGPIGTELVAAPWQVDASVVGPEGKAPAEIVWAVLDCPGGIAGMLVPEVGICVLGRLAACIEGPIEEGATCVAVGWPIEHDGRKLHAGTAIFSSAGEPLARARATWIEVKR